MRTCSVEGCERKHSGRGYCSLHYQRWWRHGTIEKFSTAKDYSGERFGKLVAIEPTPLRDISRAIVWRLKCDCGEYVIRALSSIRTSVKRGHIPSCDKCRSSTLPHGRANRNAVVASYKANARRRGIEFNLNDVELDNLFSRECYYCGAPPQNIKKKRNTNGSFVYQGIDRINNEKGYTEGNCVPCCDKCNWAKKDMTLEEFWVWIKSVAERHCV